MLTREYLESIGAKPVSKDELKGRDDVLELKSHAVPSSESQGQQKSGDSSSSERVLVIVDGIPMAIPKFAIINNVRNGNWVVVGRAPDWLAPYVPKEKEPSPVPG